MITNQDPDTGVRYTLYRADAFDPELLDDLLYMHGKDLSYAEALEQEIAEQRSAWEDECESKAVAAQEAGTDLVLDDFELCLDSFDPQIEQPIHEGDYQNIHYRTTWLGGALHIWIFRSPIVGHFALCSPCAPGACNGDQRTSLVDGHMGYDVYPNWMAREPGAPRDFADYLSRFE
jgi:hypothetical protein